MAIIQNKPNMNYGVWGSNGNIAVPTSEKVDLGWIIERPPNEVMNWLQNRQDSMLQFVNQRGIPTWDALTEYPLNAYVVRSGTLYRAVSQNVDKDPTLNSAIWDVAFATYTDYSNLYNEVQSIKDVEGYLDLYVSKKNPVMIGETKGVGYKDSTGDSGLTFSGTTPQITVSNDVVVSFKKLTDISEKSDAVATTMWVQELLKNYIDSMLPIGAIIEYSSEVVPTDNLLYAHGQAIKRSDYPELFSVIGTRYGIGDGATTFNLPDKRGLFTREWDNGKGIDSGRLLGSKQEDLIEKHQHIYPYGEAYIADAPFGYTEQKGFGGVSAPKDYDNHMFYTNTGESYLGDDPNPSGQIGSETRPKNIAMVSLIRVK